MAFLALTVLPTILAGSLWLTYIVVKLVLNRIKEPIFALPPGVRASCSFQACDDPATTGLRQVVQALDRRGEYRYFSEDRPEVYCDKHQPSFGYRHPMIRTLIAVSVWLCIIWLFLTTLTNL